MSWREDLRDRLLADAALANLLGTRIAWFEAARGWTTYPQLVMQEVSVIREATHQGHDGLDEVRVQFDIYDETAADLELIEAALLAEMEQGEVIVGSTAFGYGFLSNRGMGTDDLANTQRLHRLRMDFQFFHETV